MQEMRYPFLDLLKVNEPYLDEIRAAAVGVIDSGRYIGGDEVTSFERELAELCRVPYAVAVSNGLDALRLILRAYKEMGVMTDGDEVILPANTYIASFLAVTDNHLVPVAVDVDERTMNIDSALIEAAITPRTRAIMPVHLYGRVAWDERLAEIARSYDLKVVEDNAQAIGARSTIDGLYGTDVTGGLGHGAGLSFYPTKNIGALGDAGAVTTHDRELADTVRALANYGSDRRYHNIYCGVNCRMDPLQAAMLRVKLRHTIEENAARFARAVCYNNEIHSPLVVKPEITSAACDQVWHQYVVRVPAARRDEFRKYLEDRGVGTDIHYATPPHRQPCYQEGIVHGPLGVTERVVDEIVSLPISPATSVRDAADIAHIINEFA